MQCKRNLILDLSFHVHHSLTWVIPALQRGTRPLELARNFPWPPPVRLLAQSGREGRRHASRLLLPITFTGSMPVTSSRLRRYLTACLFALTSAAYCERRESEGCGQLREHSYLETLTMDHLTAANVKFAVDFFKHLDKADKSGNIFVSPFSISNALAMVYLGASGNTASQMAKVLAFDEVKDVHSEFQKLQLELNNPQAKYVLKTANRLFGEKTYDFLPTYLADTLKYYQAELAPVDFLTAAEKVRQEINAWAEKQTDGKITDLLAEGSVDDLTRLVLVNAIYFKGNWRKKFNKELTQDGEFRIKQHETKPVQMMKLKSRFAFTYISEVSTKILELPYDDGELSMLILLPDINDDFTGMEKLQSQLTFDHLMNWTNPDMMNEIEINVVLPKFKLEEKYDLESILMQMGMVDAFSTLQANYSAMSSRNDLVLTKVVHKSFVEVNEEGTEAAAATAAIMMLRCSPIRFDFVADHPFLFFIRHNKTRNILFFGRFSSP
ncbi:leukocyte elastase inhibitor-like [Hemitrygon akajei]|uniref:leukocyte elastase inhibitor-like n=1 Tax=Hemitrygon akajei TaxID=2704970 RepID=UPI003BF9EE3D